MHIRPVQAADADEWIRLRVALWPDSTAEDEREEVEHFLAIPPREPLQTLHAAFVYERPDGSLGGLIEVSEQQSAPGCSSDKIGYIEAWYVAPDLRGQQVGRRLVEAAEAWARERGCEEMASDTDPSYSGSPQAHAALGYDEVARYFRKELS